MVILVVWGGISWRAGFATKGLRQLVALRRRSSSSSLSTFGLSTFKLKVSVTWIRMTAGADYGVAAAAAAAQLAKNAAAMRREAALARARGADGDEAS